MIWSGQGCNKKDAQAIASGKSKRSKEGVEENEPFRKFEKYCMGCLTIKNDAKTKKFKMKRIKIKEEKECLVLLKFLWVQKETIVFDENTLDIPFLNKDQ